MTSTILLLLAAALSFVIGLVVVARDYRKIENLAFTGISGGITCWAIGIAGFTHTHDFGQALLWAKFYYLAPLVLVFSSVIFAQNFLYPLRLGRVVNYIVGLAGLILAALLLSQKTFITHAIVRKYYGNQVVLDGHQYLLYSLYLLTCFVVAILLTYRKSRHAKQPVARQQANVFVIGYTISCATGVFFNLILPGFGNYSLIVIGPVLTTVFLFAVAYAIIHHKLFDIRLVIARALGYTSSLVVLAAIYGFVVFGVAKLIFGLHFTVISQVFLSAATGIAALSFQRIKRFFDKTTNRIFYRDAYDVQELFDELNRVLVSSLDVRYLVMQSISVIETALKPGFALIGLRNKDTGYRLFTSQKLNFRQEDIDHVRRLTPHVHHKVIVADFIDDPKLQELKDLMSANGVAVLVRLTQDTRRSEEGLGYIVLGNKRSGNPYTNQDAQVLDTVSSALIIAIQNALHYEEIQNFNATLQQQVDEATRKLKHTNEKLKALDETKDDFISMASHQLRTPLTSIKGYLSMVLEGDAGKITKMQREMLSQSFFSSQRMVYLIADLLNVSRLKTGKFVIETAPVNLAEIVEQEISQLVETAAGRSLTLSYNKPEQFPEVMLDETKTRQVIMNFIDNAIYYTPAGGHIRVELADKAQTVELRVVDDGIGVPKSEQHHLFTKFYRAGNARKARPDGTGLGLFMAKKVISAQGGAVIFESEDGKGSTFGFTFSKSKLAAPVEKPESSPAKAPVA